MESNPISSIKNMAHITDRDSWLHRWEPRTKIISCITMIFGLVFLKTPKLLIASYIILTIIVLYMGFSIKGLLKRTSYILPFIILMSIPILISGGLPPSQERIDLVLLLAFKGLNALYIMFIMFFSQPIPDLLNSLAYMKLPDFFISIVFLSWRYVFLLGENFSKLYKSLVSRLFRPSIHRESLKTYGQIMGGILIKSIDTSDKVYRAMVSRGFDGRMPISEPRRIGRMDIVKSIVVVSTVVLLNIFEKWWF
ncbi:cobalt ECF transporter T component CbiQ [Tissierellaceae bacterium HCP3S3_D8]